MIEQDGFAYRFSWGGEGVEALAAHVAVVVVVDVLRFTTAVSAAVEARATVVPARWADEQAVDGDVRQGAAAAGRRSDGGPSLSPTDLLTSPAGARLVLPSPNGATIAMRARELGTGAVLAGCLRNAGATARRARELAAGAPIGVVAAGERWAQGALRHAVEDLLGAGAVLAALDPAGAASPPCCSPDAGAARAAFVAARPLLLDHLLASTSGRELAAAGSGDDVHASAVLDATGAAAQLLDGAFIGV